MSLFPSKMLSDIPRVTTRQMIEVDRAMMFDFKISLLQMMENAGRNLADFVQGFLAGKQNLTGPVVVLAGTGGNGGGVLVAARHLCNRGYQVLLVPAKEKSNFSETAAHQLTILEQMQIPMVGFSEVEHITDSSLILDGLIGYSLKGAPTGSIAELIRWANAQSSPLVSLDVPSGMNATSGQCRSPVISASATLTLALPKTGFLNKEARQFFGRLFLADISVPPQLYIDLGLTEKPVNLFAASSILHLETAKSN